MGQQKTTNATPLVIYNVLLASDGAKTIQGAYLAYLIEYVLYNKVYLTEEDIIAGINALLPIHIQPNLIQQYLEMVAVPINRDNKKCYRLENSREVSFKESIKRHEESRDLFRHVLIKYAEQFNERQEKLSGVEKKELCEATENFIKKLYADKYIILKQAASGKLFDFDKISEEVYSDELYRVLQKALPKRKKDELDCIYKGIVTALKNLDNKSSRYVGSIFQNIFALFYLNQEPDEVKRQLQLLKKRKLFLDTNVILSLLFKSQKRQKEIAALIERCRILGVQLLITRCTLEELSEQFRLANDIAVKGRFLEARQERAARGKKLEALVIIDDFFDEKIENSQLTWGAYYASFMVPLEKFLKNKYNITLDADFEKNTALATSDDFFSLHKALVDVKGKGNTVEEKQLSVNLNAIACDALNIVYVQNQRERFESDEMGLKVFYLTYDSALKRAEHIVRHIFDKRASIIVPMFANFLIPFTTNEMTEISREKFVTCLLNLDIGAIAEDETYIDAVRYNQLKDTGLPLDNIMSGVSEKDFRKVLTKIQESRYIEDLTTDYYTNNSPLQKKQICGKLAEAIKEKIKSVEENDVTDPLLVRIDALERQLASKNMLNDTAEPPKLSAVIDTSDAFKKVFRHVILITGVIVVMEVLHSVLEKNINLTWGGKILLNISTGFTVVAIFMNTIDEILLLCVKVVSSVKRFWRSLRK